MGVTRIGNLALHSGTLRDIASVQSKLATLQEQISSGIKANNFEGLNGQVEQYVQLEAKVRQSQQFIESNTLNVSRMKTADQAMGQIVDVADSMENLIVQARNTGNANALNFQQLMTGYLKDMAAQMNISFEGRYLFGGTNTGSPPVPDPMQGPAAAGVPDDGYYAGSKDNLVYRQDERTEYTFPVRADDEGFQQIIAAAHQAMEAFQAGDDTGLGSALTLMQSGQQGINDSRTNLNNTIISVSDSTDRITSMKLYWQGVTESVGKTDLVAASTEVSNHEAILQAAFQVFARLSQLRLSDFL